MTDHPHPAGTFYEPDFGPPTLDKIIDFRDIPWNSGLLVRATNWLGDTLMSLGAVRQLRSLVPSGVPVTVACKQNLAPLWRCVSWIDEVLPFSGRRLDVRCRERLSALRPDITVVLPNSFGSVWDLWRAGAGDMLGRGGRGRTPFLRHRLPIWRRRAGMDRYHEARNYLEIAGACGATTWDCAYPPLTPAITEQDLRALPALPGLNERTLVIAPGAAYGPAKQWPSAFCNVVARWWRREQGPVIAVGTPGEEESGRATLSGCDDAINLVGQTSLVQLLYVLSRAHTVLANDSGAMHLAAALGKKGVAIFGSTDPTATGPIGGTWIIVRKPLACSPCLRRSCPRTDVPYECLTSVTPGVVIESLVTLSTC